MNVFMGYNPLVSKQAKVTVWVCEQDGATPVAPSNPSEGDCFVVYATDEAVLSNTPTSKKTYANGEWADAESGGGVAFPKFAEVEADTWEGDMTYAEVESVFNQEALGTPDSFCPCVFQEYEVDPKWGTMFYVTKQAIVDEGIEFNPALPDTIVGGFAVSTRSNSVFGLYADDGNFYVVAD